MNHRGFTIIELCLAAAVAAIVFASFISASSVAHRYELKRFLQSTTKLIQTTSASALATGKPCQITISAKDKEVISQCEESTLRPQKIKAPQRISAITPMFGGADSDRLITYESGFFTPGSLLIEHSSSSCLLTVSLYGSQRISCS